MASASAGGVAQENHYVDYVIRYKFNANGQTKAIEQLELLLKKLGEVGLQTEVRQCDRSSLLIFVRASQKSLKHALHQSRVRDWLYGVRQTEPEPASAVEAQTPAERLRVIYFMITVPQEEGGAGITPKHGEWKNVVAVFPLHDVQANQRHISEFNKKTFLSEEDMDHVRSTFGEGIAFYFSFLQAYFRFLLFPAAFGFSCWLILGYFSITYAIVNCLWSVVFIEYWKNQELDLSCRWQTKGVSAVRPKRHEFKPDRELKDEGTGEIKGVFPSHKRLLRQLLQVPFALFAALGLGAIIATCFAIEIFISEVYNGPFKTYLVFIPTILLSALVPTMSAVLLSVATKLNDFENYETESAYEIGLTQKIFIINFITSYMPIFLTAFVYIPFAAHIVPYLDVVGMTVRPFVSKKHATSRTEFNINPARLRKQVIYFTVTAQFVNFAKEAILPLVKQRLMQKYKEYCKQQAEKAESQHSSQENLAGMPFEDPGEESKFLKRVRNEAALEEYDVTDDLREMCIQFGYLALFSPVWPLVPVSFVINNWVELRSDFFKICVECRRPFPVRSDTIGPWLDSLGFLSWVGSITSAALIYMFSNREQSPNGAPVGIKGWALLLTIFLSEHLYLAVRYVVRIAITKMEPPNARKERVEAYLIRKRYLDSALQNQSDDDEPRSEKEGVATPEITRRSLEDDARASTQHDINPAERFWTRQKGWSESYKVGKHIIQAQTEKSESKKEQ